MQVTNEKILRVKNHKPKQSRLKVSFVFFVLLFSLKMLLVLLPSLQKVHLMRRGGGGEGVRGRG